MILSHLEEVFTTNTLQCDLTLYATCIVLQCDIYVDQLDAQILIMCLYLSLSALHVSDSLAHHQERLLELYFAIGISR